MSPYKEPNVLADPRKDLSDYAHLFAAAGEQRYLGESSTSYLTLPSAIDKIGNLLPAPKLILMFRNPVDRAWSHYWFVKGMFGTEQQSFREAMLENMTAEPAFVADDYYQAGAYAKWLRRLEQAVSADQLHVVLFEEFIADMEAVMRDVFAFLELPYVPPTSEGRRNAGGMMKHPHLLQAYVAITHATGQAVGRWLPAVAYKSLIDAHHRTLGVLTGRLRRAGAPEMSPADRTWVADLYRKEVADLQTMLKRTFPWPDFDSDHVSSG